MSAGFRPHDYAALVRRWEKAARVAGLELEAFASAGRLPVYLARSRDAGRGRLSVYLSAGIHGDEAAAPGALLRWVEIHGRRLRELSLLVFPCLNPWGLSQNSRGDAKGRDLNRMFLGRSVEPIRSLRRIVDGCRFDVAVTLHEDFDAAGFYLYELPGRRGSVGRAILEAAAAAIGPDPRRTIEGRRADRGLISRRVRRAAFPQMPEAIWLHGLVSGWTATFETPSEFAFEARVEAHVRALDAAVFG